jgi:ribosomal-protein-alanine N-acetyltransferase
MLETTRLKLVPLQHEQLILLKNNPRALAENLNVRYIERQGDPATAADVEEAIEFWIKNTKEHRAHFEWFTNWEIILKEENVSIGGIGFAGLPNENGQSMTGYGLDIRYHQRGIATEALKAIIPWAFKNENLKTIIADTPLLNFGSHRVLQKNGFMECSRDETLIHWELPKSIRLDHDVQPPFSMSF